MPGFYRITYTRPKLTHQSGKHALGMRPVIQRRRLTVAVVLLTLSGFGMRLSGIFPETPGDPTAVAGIIHWVGGFLLGFLSAIAAFFVVGRQLRKHPRWRRYGWYSSLTAWGALALIPLQFLLLSPDSPLSAADIGGLLERAFAVVVFAWYAVLGWRLFTIGAAPRN